MYASRNGNLDAIKVLIDHKADVNAKEKLRGTTPPGCGLPSRPNPGAVKLLVANGADVKAVSCI